MIEIIKRWFVWFLQARWLWTNVQIATLQRHRSLLLQEERYQNLKRLNRFEFQVFSQNGEDGIISEIFSRIGTTNRVFIEIGVENGLENNTTFLLEQGWEGYWLEGNPKAIRFIRVHFQEPIKAGMLRAENAFVSAENIGALLDHIGSPAEPDFLSVDIDRNTYYVLAAILEQVRPRVIAVEYSALYPASMDWKVAYAPGKTWKRTSYAGASLKAYEVLGRGFNYSLVGCDLCGVNAFLVRDDLLGDRFLPPYTAENHYEPLRDYLIHRVGAPRRFTDLH